MSFRKSIAIIAPRACRFSRSSQPHEERHGYQFFALGRFDSWRSSMPTQRAGRPCQSRKHDEVVAETKL